MIAVRRASQAKPAPEVAPPRLGARAAVLALAFLSTAILAGLLAGPVRLAPGEVAEEILARMTGGRVGSGLAERKAAILWQLRMPRVVLGALVGAMLSAAGAAYQGVFRNPLADPYLLGAASGAALGATLAIQYGPSGAGRLAVPISAFAGALLGVGLAYWLGRAAGRGLATGSLILAGVAVASFLTAVQTYLSLSNEQTFREAARWILGRLSTTGWREVVVILPYVAVSAAVLLVHRRLLDVLSLGEEESESVGIRTSRVRLWVVAAASLGTAAAVAVGGLIGFVGIIVPHAVRRLVGGSYRLVLPLSLIFGGAFLVLADTLARTLLAPGELPIGVVTAFFGAPFFAVILRTGSKAA